MRKFVLLFCLTIFCFYLPNSVYAQPAILSDTVISITDPLLPINPYILHTADGGYLVGQSSEENAGGLKSQNSKGNNDYWIVKFSANGKKQWDKTIGGSKNDYLRTFIQTADGGYLLGGESSSEISGDKTGAVFNNSDYWIVKLSANGTIEWDQTIGTLDFDLSLAAIKQTIDGGYVILANSSMGKGGDKSQDSKGGTDAWLIKLSKEGKKEWKKTLGSIGEDYFGALVQDLDGNYVLAGTSDAEIGADKTQKSRGAQDYWVIKVSPDGTKLWDRTLGGDRMDELSSIALTSDGGYLLGGTSNSSNSSDKSESSPGFNRNADYWIVKLSTSGKKDWDKPVGSFGDERLVSAAQTSDGGYILAGVSASAISRDKSEPGRGLLDYWVVKLGADRTKRWDKTIGGSRNDDPTSIYQENDGGYTITGTSYSGISGDKTRPNALEFSTWIVRLGPDTLLNSLATFSAVKQGSTARLNWSTGLNTKIDHFDLEQSTDLKNWNKVGSVPVKSTSGDSVFYEFVHNEPLPGDRNWYRLAIVDEMNQTAYRVSNPLLFSGTALEIEWDKTIGGTNTDQMQVIRQTLDGGYILGGTSYSPAGADKTGNLRGETDYWVVKVNAAGTKEWDKTYGGSSEDVLVSIRQTSDGGYIMAGNSSSEAGFDKLENRKDHEYDFEEDFWVIKVNSQGVKEWDRTIGSYDGSNFADVFQTSDGGYLLGGSTASDISGDKTDYSRGNVDYWIVKLGPDGTKQWDKNFGGLEADHLRAMDQTADGGYILGGSSKSGSSGDKSESTRGYENIWVVKLDSAGSKQWDKTLGPNGQLHTIRQTADSGYIIGGISAENASYEKTEDAKGLQDIWIVKITAEGVFQWDKTIGTAKTDEINSLVPTLDGGYLVGATVREVPRADSTFPHAGRDYQLVKLRENGAIEWERYILASGEAKLSGVQQTDDGGFIIGGTSDAIIAEDKTEGSKGGEDYWIVKLAGDQPPLPVTLTSFTARKENTAAVLTWQTSSETQSHHFEVEHSQHGKAWNSIEIVNAKSESNAIQTYHYTHSNPVNGDNYYRLKMVDTDGTFTYSRIEHVKIESGFEVSVYPNPAAETIHLDAADWSKVKYVQILGIGGKVLYSSESKPFHDISIKTFKTGLYIIKLTLTDGTETTRKIAVGQ